VAGRFSHFRGPVDMCHLCKSPSEAYGISAGDEMDMVGSVMGRRDESSQIASPQHRTPALGRHGREKGFRECRDLVSRVALFWQGRAIE